MQRYRQIHLDFHTSPVINDVGEDFDINDFVQTLKDAHVNSINIFAKCHHGMCYYPTKVGTMHPSLKFDLLGTMINALHDNDIKCPIYFPLGWEEDSANHTEWLEMGMDGVPGHKLPTESGYYRWRKLCLNNPEYRKYIKAQLRELMDNYEVDGFWFDIISQENCMCPTCMKELLEMGYIESAEEYDPTVISCQAEMPGASKNCAVRKHNERILKQHDDQVLINLQDDLNRFLSPSHIEIVYNTGWVPDGGYDEHTIEVRSKKQGHVELESLPSGEWGYSHFPLLVNFHNRDNAPLVGMNGKFHLSWGDHGSLKNQEALEFECFRMIANGCMACVGDQLHPRGAMNHSAYRRIGRVYEEIEKLEPYLINTTKCAEIGVVSATDFYEKDTSSDEGVLRMLSELHYVFDIITTHDDLSRYKLLILPDHVKIDAAFDDRLRNYLASGGRVLATYQSCSPALGVSFVSDNAYTPSYIVVDEDVNKKLGLGPVDDEFIFAKKAGVETNSCEIDPLEYVCYETGAYIETSLPVIAQIGNPYFNRTAECFSSHRHFPFNKISKWPAIVMGNAVGSEDAGTSEGTVSSEEAGTSEDVKCVGTSSDVGLIGYCAFPLFRDYIINGNRVYRDIIAALIRKLLPQPLLKINAPTSAEVTVRKQRCGEGADNNFSSADGGADRMIIHILSYIPERRTKTIDIVDTKIPLYNVEVKVRVDEGQVFLARAGISIPAEITPDGYLSFVIPCIDGYEVVVVEY